MERSKDARKAGHSRNRMHRKSAFSSWRRKQESKSMKKSECMCARVCEKDHARKREIESKKENEWNGARKR